MNKVLRFKDLAPEIYSNQSRDFQMMTRLLDLTSNAQKHKVEQSFFLNNPELCPSGYLRLLAHKLGFDYQSIIYESELRQVLTSFKYLVSYKGSLRGISETINLFMNVKKEYFQYSISVDNKNAIIYIDLHDRVISDLSMLSDILRYILPCGYTLKYRPLVKTTLYDASADYGQKIEMALLNSINNTAIAIKSPDEGSFQNIPNDTANRINSRIVNAFNTMQVVSNEQISDFEVENNNETTYKAVGLDIDIDTDGPNESNEPTFN